MASSHAAMTGTAMHAANASARATAATNSSSAASRARSTTLPAPKRSARIPNSRSSANRNLPSNRQQSGQGAILHLSARQQMLHQPQPRLHPWTC